MSEFFTRGEVAHFVALGLTPAKVERAIKKGGVRRLSQEFQVKQPVITQLAQRWGIKRRAENEA